ncbi:MAG: HslU--HslV peptidase proteolytic subunit, partial [Alphaproteobacteria bacterium]
MPTNDATEVNGIWRRTTILSIRKNGRVVVAGDGQVSLGPTV